MRLDPIDIVPYDPEWPTAYAHQRDRVTTALGDWLTGPVEHIGSTSVPGLPAKPIIDMLARVPKWDPALTWPLAEALAGVGWVHAPEPADDAQRKWSFCFPDAVWRTHHLHVVGEDWDWRPLLAFRDHLRTHPDDAAEYARIKTELAAADRHDRPAYRAGKAPFIESILARL
ncbi:GrpB family protein [Hamadaea sp. NPDC050747]|uniref:GrpB family protein n=1 Tax=Hamadaea sp. NPDC050747 TaxID=3155789 RepID=UPI0033D3BC80